MLLTNPFYEPGANYSGALEGNTGVVGLDMSYYISGGLSLVARLIAAGWTVVATSASWAQQDRPEWYFSTGAPGAGTPVEMTPAQCTTLPIGPGWRYASIGSKQYYPYDPRYQTPTCPDGTGNMRWYPVGTTTFETAENLCDRISADEEFAASVVDAGVSGITGYYRFTFVSLAENIWGFDNINIGVGGGDRNTSLGYYELRSGTSERGVTLTAKVQNRRAGSTQWTYITVTASGGGTYYDQPIKPGLYVFAGCQFQFWIGPNGGGGVSSYLASIVEAPRWHATAGDCPLVVGSDNGALAPNNMAGALHWSGSMGTGHAGELRGTYYGAGVNAGYQKVALLCRGTIGRVTTTLGGQTLIQAPYVALPESPNSGPGPVIAGKLWNMVLTTGKAEPGTTMRHDGRLWQCIGRSALSADVGCDWWALAEGAEEE